MGGVGIEFIYLEGNHLSLLLWSTWLQVPVTDFLFIYLFLLVHGDSVLSASEDTYTL